MLPATTVYWSRKKHQSPTHLWLMARSMSTEHWIPSHITGTKTSNFTFKIWINENIWSSLSVPESTTTYTMSLALTLNTVANNIQASVLFSQEAYPTSARGCNIQTCSVNGGAPTCNLNIDSCRYSTTTTFYIAVQLYGTGTAAYVPYTITINVVGKDFHFFLFYNNINLFM